MPFTGVRDVVERRAIFRAIRSASFMEWLDGACVSPSFPFDLPQFCDGNRTTHRIRRFLCFLSNLDCDDSTDVDPSQKSFCNETAMVIENGVMKRDHDRDGSV